jgi:hypothetical protein
MLLMTPRRELAEPDPSTPPVSGVDLLPPPVEASTDTTRHLSAACHLDPDFRDSVLEETIQERHRAIAPSFGVEMSVVARHAVVADRRALLRDAALVPLLAGLAAIAASWVVSLATPDAVDGPYGGMLPDAHLLGIAALVLSAAAWCVVAADAWLRFSTLSAYLLSGRRPEDLPLPRGRRMREALDDLAAAGGGNVVVFSDPGPFIGSGVPVKTISYSSPLDPRSTAAGAKKPVDFTANEFMNVIADSLNSLQLRNFRLEPRVFVHGLDVAHFPQLLPDPAKRPVTRVSAPVMTDAIEQHGAMARPYLCVEANGWKGQLVVTSFIRVVRLKRALFLELATQVLPPLELEYRLVDRMRIRTRGERLVETVGYATATVVGVLLTSPWRLARRLLSRGRAAFLRLQHRRRLARRVRIDYGAETSVRERAASDRYARYFMACDGDMYLSVVEERLFGTIESFLSERGYRIDHIRAVQNITNITNSRIGDIYRMSNVGSNNAIGPQASATGRYESNGSNSGSYANPDARGSE